jgi:hypothetical protein
MDWVVEQGFDVANMSLSTHNRDWYGHLHALADDAFFNGTVLVCAVNNVARPTYPSQFAAVVSVATGGPAGTPLSYNVEPPAEFGAPGSTFRWPGSTVPGQRSAATPSPQRTSAAWWP